MTKLSYEGTPGESKGGMLHRDFTAKEMFKKNGYKEKFDTLRYLVYEKEYKDRTIAIHFDKKYKKVAKFKLGLSVYYQERKDVEISLKELQAINKQVEELGWK